MGVVDDVKVVDRVEESCLMYCFIGKGANLTDLTMCLGCWEKACLGVPPNGHDHSCQYLGCEHCLCRDWLMMVECDCA